MLKKIIIFTLLLLLIGCEDSENIELLRTEIEDAKDQIDIILQSNSEMNQQINQLNSMIADKNGEILDLKNNIEKLNQSEHNHYLSNIGEEYKEYMILFTYDALRELESYSISNGLISNYSKNLETIEIDLVEFVAYYDYERIEELNIDTSKNPITGSYIFNDPEEKETYELSKNFKFYVYDWNGTGELIEKSLEEYLEENSDSETIFKFDIINNKVIRITEYYLN